MKHQQAITEFKNTLDTMVQEREIRADYANQLIRLLRIYMPQYAAPCGFGVSFDFVAPRGQQTTFRRTMSAATAPTTEATPQKKSGAEPVEVDRPEAVAFAAIPTYNTASVLQQIGAESIEAITPEQATALRIMAQDLGLSVGPNSKPATIIAKIVEAYAGA
jgi:hypothetical protein